MNVRPETRAAWAEESPIIASEGQRPHAPAEPAPAAQTAGLPVPRAVRWFEGSGQRLVLAAAVLVFLVSRWLTVAMPLERDEGEYAYIAQRLLAGETPYLDQFNQKTPGIFGVYATAFALGGTSVTAIHLAMALATALTAVLIWQAAVHVVGRGAAAWAALAFVVMSIDPRLLATAANTEAFGNLALALAALAVIEVRRARGWWWSAACGIGVVSACMFKQVAALPGAWITLAWLAAILRPAWGAGGAGDAQSPSSSRRGVHLAAFVAGSGLVVLPILWFFTSRGAMAALVDGVLTHNLAYIRRHTLAEAGRAASQIVVRQGPSLAVFVAAAAIGLFARGRESGVLALFGGWLAASAAAASVSFNFYEHYSIWLLPPLAVLAGGGMASLVERVSRGHPGPAGLAAGGAFLVILGCPLAANASFWLAGSPEQRARVVYGQNLCTEAARIAEHIRASSDAAATVLILGSEPQILYHAGRRSATRYIIMYPLFGPYADAARRQQEVVEEITAAPPDWILDVQIWNSRTPDAARPQDLERKVAGMIAGQGRYELEGLAVPRPGEQRYELKLGDEARALGDRARKAAEGGVLIYRRVK